VAKGCTHTIYIDGGREFKILSQLEDDKFEISAAGYCFDVSFAGLEASNAGRWLLVKYRWLYLMRIFIWLGCDLWGRKASKKLALRKNGEEYVIEGGCCDHETTIPEADVIATFSGWLFLPQNEKWHKFFTI
jgi:hypothetical protein